MIDLLRALRPYQWSKNVLVFVALVFTLDLFHLQRLLTSATAFVLFCAASSAVYLFNDISDKERDRHHPEKRFRPIAAGKISVGVAATAGSILGMGSLLGAYLLQPQLVAVIGGYFFLQLGYNLGLKQVAILDALSVAAGFLLRVVAGSVAIQVEMSNWLLICTIFLSVFLSFAKRRHETSTLDADGAAHREALSGYSLHLLDQLVGVTAGATLISYALYTTDPETIEKFGSSRLILTLPFAIYGIFRYMTLVYRDEGTGDPAKALVTDRPLLLTAMLWGVTVVVLLYMS